MGTILLLATASFVAGATVVDESTARAAGKSAASTATGSDAQAETDAIFGDGATVSVTQLGVSQKARAIYQKGVLALQRGRASEAERDAERAMHADATFSDAYALAATAQLSQRNFLLAQSTAKTAMHADASNLKAYVILATADNYLGQYSAAVVALTPVLAASTQWWQIAYQQARAEAGLEHAQAALEWSNRAALRAPAGFAPLHLLHASALVASAQYAQAADELETYLALEGEKTPQREELERELGRLRKLASTGNSSR
ncbi:MAG TPA: hypothetical protein VHX63_02385 [Acidobacteriaceae bacterium]|nr:hypothetical protein [Acidobacteriaceae bacterium]